MSVKVMGNVWELDLAPAHKLVLLAMADHADHDGRNVHPSVRLIASKTGYSERQVQRIWRDLEAANILIPDYPNDGGRGHTTHYRIVTGNGDILTPFRKGDMDEERVTSATGKGDIGDIKGDIAMSPEPSIEPSIEQHAPLPPNGQNGRAEPRADETYIELLGPDRITGFVAALKEIDPHEFSTGWLRNRLREFRRDVPDLSFTELRDGLNDGYDRLAQRCAQDRATIHTVRGLARTYLLEALKEQIS